MQSVLSRIWTRVAVSISFDDNHYNHGHLLFTNHSARAGYDTRSIFKRSLTGLNSEFSFSCTSCLTKAKEPILSYYLPIVGGRIIGLIPFTRVLLPWEMQLAWSRIWTRVAVSISYNDNHYTMDTSTFEPFNSVQIKLFMFAARKLFNFVKQMINI